MTKRTSTRWGTWGASFTALIVTTLVMLVIRGTLDKAHVALIYLIIVLLGSASGGRALGLMLASLAFLAFNLFFLPPYGTLTIANPLDWLVLVAFLVASLVAAQLLARTQAEAEDARARTAEVERLSELGSETLNVVHAEDALSAIADVIRTTLGIDQCDVYVCYAPGVEPTLAAHSGIAVVDGMLPEYTGAPDQHVGRSLLAWVSVHGVAAAERMDHTLHVPPPQTADTDAREILWSDFTGVRVLTVPLRVRDRTVGVLRLAHAAGIQLLPQQQLFLDALTYYTALGVERVRLAAEAKDVETMREADRLKNALLAAVSHDLRTPLTTIKALAHDVADRGAEAGDARVVSIEEEADRLTALVADLLDLSRLTGGALHLHPAVNTAEDLIGAAMDRVSGIRGLHPIHILQDRTAPMLLGRFDFVHALRALVNLIENAVKYSPPESVIDLSVRRDGAMVVFTVADRGPGVPESERERIFAPFYRPPGVPPDVRGAGLGLAIARGLAVAQGGTIRYESRAGGGSLFHLLLPAVDNVPQMPGALR